MIFNEGAHTVTKGVHEARGKAAVFAYGKTVHAALTALDAAWWISAVVFVSFLGILALIAFEDLLNDADDTPYEHDDD